MLDWMKRKFTTSPGRIVPWYMGYFHYSVIRHKLYVAPVPLNFVLAFIVSLWMALRAPLAEMQRFYKDQANLRCRGFVAHD